MQQHLTPEQITRWCIGDRSQEIEAHLLACRSCFDELQALQTTLSQFRHTVHDWSDSQFESRAALQQYRLSHRQPFYANKLYWALSLLLLCGLIRFSLRPAVQVPFNASALKSDAALLMQVDRAVSRTVPEPMEPLMRLVSWDGKSSSDWDDTSPAYRYQGRPE